MAALSVKGTVSRAAGLDLTAALDSADEAGDTFAAGPDVYLRVKNGYASPCTVTVLTAGTVAGPRGTFLAPLALAPAVGATTGDRLYGPFPADTFADPADGRVDVSYSVATTVTVGVYRITN